MYYFVISSFCEHCYSISVQLNNAIVFRKSISNLIVCKHMCYCFRRITVILCVLLSSICCSEIILSIQNLSLVQKMIFISLIFCISFVCCQSSSVQIIISVEIVNITMVNCKVRIKRVVWKLDLFFCNRIWIRVVNNHEIFITNLLEIQSFINSSCIINYFITRAFWNPTCSTHIIWFVVAHNSKVNWSVTIQILKLNSFGVVCRVIYSCRSQWRSHLSRSEQSGVSVSQ